MKKQVERNLKKELFSWMKALSLGAVAGLAINCTLIVNATVPTGSMESTIMPGNRIIGSRLAYTFSSPQRGEIIIFPYPDDESVPLVKRIVGMPGETVEIREGRVYIDGSGDPLPEPYLQGIPSGDYGPYLVPEDCYFVMGDNRNHSLDSRFWENPFVSREKITAKAGFCYYPRPYVLR